MIKMLRKLVQVSVLKPLLKRFIVKTHVSSKIGKNCTSAQLLSFTVYPLAYVYYQKIQHVN